MANLLDEARALKPVSRRQPDWLDKLNPAEKEPVLQIIKEFHAGKLKTERHVLAEWLMKRLKLDVTRDTVARTIKRRKPE